MYPLVAGRKVTARGGHGSELAAVGGRELNFRPDCIPIALVSDEFQGQPVVIGRSCVVQNMGLTIVGRHQSIRSPIIVNVTSRQAACDPRVQEGTPPTGGDVVETGPGL